MIWILLLTGLRIYRENESMGYRLLLLFCYWHPSLSKRINMTVSLFCARLSPSTTTAAGCPPSYLYGLEFDSARVRFVQFSLRLLAPLSRSQSVTH